MTPLLILSLVAQAGGPTVTDFAERPQFVYGSFEKNSRHRPGAFTVTAPDGRGGMGVNFAKDYAPHKDDCPALTVKPLAGNRALFVTLLFQDAERRKRAFRFDLVGLKPGVAVTLEPKDGLSLTHDVADPKQAGFDPSRVTQFQIVGEYQKRPTAVELRRVAFAKPSTAAQAARVKYARRLEGRRKRAAAEAARAEAARRKLLGGAPHPADGADVTAVLPAGPGRLALEIRDRDVTNPAPVPYKPQPGDKFKTKGENVLAWKDGSPATVPKGRELLREVGKRYRRVGVLSGDGKVLVPDAATVGTALSLETVDEPAAYRVTSTEDMKYSAGVRPLAVGRKTKPAGLAADGQMPLRHWVFLELPRPLKGGATYTVEFVGVNTRQKSLVYRHDPRTARSPAVHATQVGYRPTDPYKRAYLSLWAGTGGGKSFAAKTFELIDEASGKTAFTGRVRLAFPKGKPENFRVRKNYNQADVHHLDFSGFAEPGRYRVYVPGVGCSRPFAIGRGVWGDAFRVSMGGLLHHRSGCRLGPPATPYRRPRNMHPADGVKIFQTDVTVWDGESGAIRESLARLLKSGTQATVADAWGGYMDAGDWDRRSQHLEVSYMLLELASLFPDRLAEVKLSLPPAEAKNRVPDVIDEALWNVDFYRRLQRPNGGVCGGVESTAHPRPGEASWQESLLIGVFAPDPETTARFAACAAKAAGLLTKIDPELSRRYRDAALKAWGYARAETGKQLDAAASRGVKKVDQVRKRVRAWTAVAAVELYGLTGERQYHEALTRQKLLPENASGKAETHALFAYCRLSEKMTDATKRRAALAAVTRAADAAMRVAEGNAYGLTLPSKYLPLIGYTVTHSVPGSASSSLLPRAYLLTGDAKYLSGAVRAANFTAGANPMDMTMTTGLGRVPPRHPLHIDSQVSGQPAPSGITVYGPNDPSLTGGAVDWAHTWYLSKSMTPNSRTWPAAEFYVDLPNWPPMTEYTVHQTIGPCCYYWGFLASRK